jgi:hypothetical protein
VIEQISSLEELDESAPDEVIQVIRSPRAVAERFERLVLEAERQIDVLTKPPFVLPATNLASNPAQEKAQRRGVRCRSLYEKTSLEDAGVKPYLANWIAAGEEARVYDGELPQKLAIFDSQIVLVPLIRPQEPMKTVLIRHPQLAQTLTLAFEYLWERSEPVAPVTKMKAKKSAKAVTGSSDPSQSPPTAFATTKSTQDQASPRLGSNSHRRRANMKRKAAPGEAR